MPTLDSPIIVPAQGEEHYDQVWFTGFSIYAPDPNQPVIARASARFYRVDPITNLKVYHPTETEREMTITDLYGLAHDMPQFSPVIQSVIDSLFALMKSQGIF